MSAWRVGAEAVPARTLHLQEARAQRRAQASPGLSSEGPEDPGSEGRREGEEPRRDVARNLIDRLTKWIPGDVLALYMAAVTASAASGSKPSPLLLIVFVLLTPGVVVGSHFASAGEIPRATLLPAGLAAGAFAIWTLSVPLSGWQSWDLVSDNQGMVAVAAAAVALIYGLFAEGMTRRQQDRGGA